MRCVLQYLEIYLAIAKVGIAMLTHFSHIKKDSNVVLSTNLFTFFHIVIINDNQTGHSGCYGIFIKKKVITILHLYMSQVYFKK